MALAPQWYTFLVGLFASLGSFLFGYDLGQWLWLRAMGRKVTKNVGIIASILPSTNFQATMGPRFQDPNQQGLVTSYVF